MTSRNPGMEVAQEVLTSLNEWVQDPSGVFYVEVAGDKSVFDYLLRGLEITLKVELDNMSYEGSPNEEQWVCAARTPYEVDVQFNHDDEQISLSVDQGVVSEARRNPVAKHARTFNKFAVHRNKKKDYSRGQRKSELRKQALQESATMTPVEQWIQAHLDRFEVFDNASTEFVEYSLPDGYVIQFGDRRLSSLHVKLNRRGGSNAVFGDDGQRVASTNPERSLRITKMKKNVREAALNEDYYGNEGDKVYIDQYHSAGRVVYTLVNIETLMIIDKRFESPEQAGRYAAGQGLILVGKDEAEDHIERTFRESVERRRRQPMIEHVRQYVRTRRLAEGRVKELDALKTELDHLTNPQLSARLKSEGIDSKQFFDGKHINRSGAIAAIVDKEIQNIATRTAIKESGEGEFGVFDSESGKCDSSYATRVEAETRAKQLNATRKNVGEWYADAFNVDDLREDTMGQGEDLLQTAIKVSGLHGCLLDGDITKCEIRPEANFNGAVTRIAKHFGVEPTKRGEVITIMNPKGRGGIMMKLLGSKRVAIKRT